MDHYERLKTLKPMTIRMPSNEELLTGFYEKLHEVTALPPRVLYHGFKPYLIVDNTK